MKTKINFLKYGLFLLILTTTACSKEGEEDTTFQEPKEELGVLDARNIEGKSFSPSAPKDDRLILDDFTTGPITKLTFEDTSGSRHLQGGRNIIGGFRQVYSRVNQNPFHHDMQLSIQDGLLVMTYAYDTRGTTYVNYGVDKSGLAPLALSLNDYSVLKVRFAAKSTVNGIYISLFTGNSRAVYRNHVPAREGVMDVTIPLNELNIVAENFDLEQVDYIRFQFDSRSKTGCSMAIEEIWFE